MCWAGYLALGPDHIQLNQVTGTRVLYKPVEHNAELQKADPGIKDMGYFCTRAIFSHTMPKMDLY